MGLLRVTPRLEWGNRGLAQADEIPRRASEIFAAKRATGRAGTATVVTSQLFSSDTDALGTALDCLSSKSPKLLSLLASN